PIGRREHVVSLVGEGPDEHLADPGVVVDDQDPMHAIGLLHHTGVPSVRALVAAPTGRVKENVLPRPGPSLSTRIRPPWASTSDLVMYRPSPTPPTDPTTASAR